MENNLVEFDRKSFIITVRPDGEGELVIKKDDVQISYFSGGPGGQNVNRNLKGVQLIYHIPDSHRRTAFRTQQLVTRVIGRRSLHHNIETAFEQLAKKLQSYFYVPPIRKATKTPKRAKEKRLQSKKIQSLKKESRQKIDY